MARIVYSVSSIGLGHASRAVAIAEELTRLGHEVTFLTSGLAANFLESYGFNVSRIVRHPVPWVLAGRMVFPTLWYTRYWLNYKISKKVVNDFFMMFKPDVVVCDEEFASLVAAKENGLKTIVITDEFQLGFTKNRISSSLEKKIQNWFLSVLNEADMVIVPDDGISTKKVFYVGKVVRKVSQTREQIRLKYRLPLNSKLILFSMTGSQLGRFLLEKTVLALKKINHVDTCLAVSGNSSKLGGEGISELGFVRDNHELIFASDLVVTTAGKSTIDEALAFGTPIIAIPIGKHYEQEKNAAELGFSYNDINRLDKLIVEKIAKRKNPVRAEGAFTAASLIERLASL
jgi:UDP-N-acetylglucosamine--N-acetylmuramyl-(pentapeptide) pyrophosphoryl-undecaprenol N-acetylglucosamine transferase